MSAKAIKKYGDIKVPAQSILPNADKHGYLTKQGGSIKTWKRRYFILKDKTIYYYKTPKDIVFTGKIELESTSLVKDEQTQKKNQNMISIQTSKRVFLMFTDTPEEKKEWIDAISKSISKIKSRTITENNDSKTTSNNNLDKVISETPKIETNTTPTTIPSTTNPSTTNPIKIVSTVPSAGVEVDISSPRLRLYTAKDSVLFLKDDESKVLEFWQIWSESIPPREDLTIGFSIDFYVSISADMQKLQWRTNGPQNIFIQKMVDFFWNVGAPESEIDRLNDVGALINPVKIGSWIDMSAKGGMDGGWYFPVDIPLDLAVEAADTGEAIKKFLEWGKRTEITTIFSVGRDMGAAPPRQTELKFKLPGSDFDEQIRIAMDAYRNFGFPPLPENVMNILNKSKNTVEPLCMSVITSSEGFVRLGLLLPKPSIEIVLELCSIGDGNSDQMASFEGSLGTNGPQFAEFQYLMKGFGYGVYKEGFDIVFHYSVGPEFSPN
jgi:hypothetical protein